MNGQFYVFEGGLGDDVDGVDQLHGVVELRELLI